MSRDVAVVIPAHNAGELLAVGLRSLQQQTLPPRQVIVVDDGSTDDTVEVANRCGVEVVRQEQRGPGAARNRGVRATSSELVAFLDADDWFAPAKLERQVALLDELDARAVACDAWVVEDGCVVRRKNTHRVVPRELTFDYLLQDNPVICSTVVARRDALEQAGMFDEEPELVATEDYDLWLRMAQHEPLIYLAEPLAFYRVHAGSLTSNERFLRGVDHIMDKLEAQFGQDPQVALLLQQRRAQVRLDLAWDLLQARGRRRDARALIRQAQAKAFSWKGLRMWLRSFVG